MISILFVPFELFKPSSLDTTKLDYKNCFKIITNKNYFFPNLKKYFIEKILEKDYKLIEERKLLNIYENDTYKNLYKHTIYTYYEIEKHLNPELKKNTFYLISLIMLIIV